MKVKALLVILTLMVILVTGCNENSIKQINRDVLNSDNFICIGIHKTEETLLVANIMQRRKNKIKNISISFENKGFDRPLDEIIQNNNIKRMYYIEGIYKKNKWYLNEWEGNTIINKKRDQYTMKLSFNDFVKYRDFQGSAVGTAIKYNKVDSINHYEKERINNKNWKEYSGKFDLTINKTGAPFYKGEYIIIFNENNKSVFEFYDIDPTRAEGKVNYYRRFWYGDDVELVLNDENDDFAEIFQEYFKKAQFDLFLEKIRNIEQ